MKLDIHTKYLKVDFKPGSAIICEEILKNGDYQLGHTKVFLKDEQELFLEQERDKALTKKILIIQKHIKGLYVILVNHFLLYSDFLQVGITEDSF